MNKAYFSFFFLLLTCFYATAQNDSAVRFQHFVKRMNDGKVMLDIKAKIQKGIQLYSLDTSINKDIHSSLFFDSSINKKQSGGIIESANKKLRRMRA